jgi:protein SCO1
MDLEDAMRCDVGTIYPRKLALRSLAAALCVILAGCGRQQAPPAAEQRYALKGKVVSIDKSQNQIVVDGQEIPGFMAAMAMPYPVVDPKLLDAAAPGDQITADVVVGNNSAHLENIVVVKKADPGKPSGNLEHKLSPDAIAPNFEFVNQDGKHIQLHQYRGKALLITFIYTRCPLPEYCPLLTHNFAEIEKSLAKTPAAYARTHLLSISFDSDHDTPDVLRNYSRSFMAKPAFGHWEFATIPKASRAKVASYFNLFLSEEDGQITHSMTTALIAPDGTVQKWYSSNDWKPADVLADLTQSAVAPS